MVIWKFPLAAVDRQAVEMPRGAQVLAVEVQHGTICLWAMCDKTALTENRHFAVMGADRTMPAGLKKFIGTVLMPPFVWHVFECE